MSDTPALHINMIGGNCPVQAEGVLSGEPFYFRARGNHWSLSVGGSDVVGYPNWFHQESYGDEPFAAGWMTTDEAIGFIRHAAEIYLSLEVEPDGQPDEMQEWSDYDPDC